MKIAGIRTITGPNVYSHNPVLVMKLHLEELTERESFEIAGCTERLLTLLPGLGEHVCAKGEPGGFVERLNEGTYFSHVIEHVALELFALAGFEAFHGKTRQAEGPGIYNIIVEYQAEEASRYLLRAAVELVEATALGQSYPIANTLEDRLAEARKIGERAAFGPSTQAIVEAARRRGIPVSRIGNGSLVQLGYGKYRKLIQAAMTDKTSAIAVDIASDKELTKTLLRQASIPVPYGRIVESELEALDALREMDVPVAVKPLNGCQGKGVSLNLSSEAQLRNAFRIAQQYSRQVLVEEMLRGRDYRVLVIDGKALAASERLPAQIIGDGKQTIAELIEVTNRDPRRGDGHNKQLTRIRIDEAMIETLRKRGFSIHSVPRAEQVVYLRECANLSTGGTAKDVTPLMHPEIAVMCERAARLIGLDVCGIDLILEDISKPPDRGNGIVEINASPGLRMHLAPSQGQSRDVGDAIVGMMYPDGTPSRIPIISITGTNGKTTITRMIARSLADSGKIVGMTTTDGIYLDGKQIAKGDTTGPVSARTILSDPAVEVAVLETARGGLVRSGLAYDWSDISIISNVRLDHIGQDGIVTLDDLLHIKSLLAERVRDGGTLVLNADDERLAQLMENPRVSRVKKTVIYFSLRPDHVLIRRHLDAGGTAYLLDRGWLVEAQGNVRSGILRASEIPVTLDGAADFQVANALAAAAACRAYGLSREAIAETLMNFSSCEHNVGRANLYGVADGFVLVDYGHNPDAFQAICKMASQWAGRTVTGVIAVPGDRDNSIVEQAGRAAAHGFHRLIIKEDRDLRGRQRGEIAGLLCQSARAEKADLDCRVILDESEALRTALRAIEPEEIVVVFYEKLEPVLSVLRDFGATPLKALPSRAYQVPAARGVKPEGLSMTG